MFVLVRLVIFKHTNLSLSPPCQAFHFIFISEMGAHRASDQAAGPLPGYFSLHSRVEGQDGALQHKRAQTGERKRFQLKSEKVSASSTTCFDFIPINKLV